MRNLPFPLNAASQAFSYVARNLIYHLFRSLRLQKGETVLVPDYHHGNEVRAIRAAGASIRFYPIRENLKPDLAELNRLCTSDVRVLFVIHYLGWPQPIHDLLVLCKERGIILIEDCALSLLSQTAGRPLGTFGDYAIFCLYKTVPLPNGGLLVQNRNFLEELNASNLKPCGFLSLAGRTTELMLEWIRTRASGFGKALFSLKRAAGQALTSVHAARLPVGDIGFDLSKVDTGISPLCLNLMRRFDYSEIRQKRRENFRRLQEKLGGQATPLLENLEEGVCPLFFPLLVPDKRAARRALRDRGIETVEFWNYGDPEAAGNPYVAFLRRHVLELPIHQDVTSAHVEYMAEQVLKLREHFSLDSKPERTVVTCAGPDS